MNLKAVLELLINYLPHIRIEKSGGDIKGQFLNAYFRNGNIEHTILGSDTSIIGQTTVVEQCFSYIFNSLLLIWFDIMYVDPITSRLQFFIMISASKDLKEKRNTVADLYNWIANKGCNINIFQDIVKKYKKLSLSFYADRSSISDSQINLDKNISHEIDEIVDEIIDSYKLYSHKVPYNIIYNAIETRVHYIISKQPADDKISNKDFITACIINRLMFSDRKWRNLYMYEIPNIGGQSIGRFSITSEQNINELDQILLQTFCFILLSPFIQEYLNNIRLQEIQQEATKSAKSAIMSRNMSHNLGSHVMAYLKQKLGSVADILKEENRVLANLEIKHIDQMLETHGIKTSELELPFLVGLGRFIGYLQERQDYIATVATDYIPYGAPVNMKDAIYDELNPDLRYMRHHSNGDKSQNRPANILMNYIAKSEGLSRENLEKRQSGSSPTFNTINDIRFGFVAYCDEKPLFFGINPDNCNSDNEALFIMRKVNFSLPGGLVGRQAVFSIVENIIRNAAKHGNRSAEQNLDLIFDVIDGADVVAKKEEITTQRLSETSQELFCRANRNDVESLYIITLTDNLLITKQKVRDITNKGLAEEYIDDDGKMKTGNKGIKEMRISAAWIRRQTDENKYLKMDDESAPGSKLAPLLLAEWVNPTLGESLLLNNSESDTSGMENEKGHLRYIFCLPKNRFAAVILDEKQDPRMWNKLHKMAPNDWTIYEGEKAIDDFCKNDNKSFDFIIVADDSIRRKILPHASNRVVIWDNNIVLSDKNLENEVKERIYALYTGIRKNDTPIYIWDNKSFESHGKEKIAPGIKLCSSEEYQDDALYAYRTHHSTETDFQAYWKEKQNKYKNLICVDAVTGDNSSDRLVRREVLDTRWYYMHLYAMRKRVAVFDERIFRIIHDVEETAFIKGREDVIEYLEELDNLPEGDLESFKDKVLPIFNFQESVQVIHAETKKEIQELLLRKKVSFIPLDGFSMQTIFQSDRGVDVFTIIREAPFRFSIVGCICCKYKDEAHPYVCTFDKIGTLSIVNSEYKIEFINKEFMNRYDYITIHQGILDKIYEGMDIKHDDKAKTQVTECIYTGFMQNPEKIDFVDNNTECQFLPRFIIHSGRAKPTHEDMPQHQPFIQYAAIENGIKDCKYSLIELLDYARYE